MKAITGIIIFVLILMGLFCAGFVIGTMFARQAAEFEKLYNKIQSGINQRTATKKNWITLNVMIETLKSMRHKNPEKMDVLLNNFNIKFGKFRIESHLNKRGVKVK